MEARNGKWVNVDYSQRVAVDETASHHHHSTSAYLPSSPPPPPSTSTDEYRIQITVSEPVKQGEGMNAYISYKISTFTNRPQFTKSSFSVIRRYSDFVWLHGNLSSMYPGVVVPPLPEKLLVGRFSQEFIESRRRALQVFLQRCCLHPELQHSEHLTTFLEATDDALAAFKADPKHAGAKGHRGALFQWFDDTVTTISTTLGAAASVQLEKTSADIEVDEMMNYIDGLEPIMTGLHKHANGLTKRAREIADGLFEFGVAYSLLGKSEENPSLQVALREIAHCSDRLSLLAAEYAEKEAMYFEEPILDYIRLVGAVKAALQKRNEVRVAYGMAVADLDAKTAIVQKLMKNRSASEEKYQVAESDVMKAQQRVDDAKLEYDIVTERVMREVERFKREKLADFKRIVLDYVQMQIAYSKKVEDEWGQVIPKISQIRISSPSDSMQSIGSTTSSGPLSMIQENYIPSSGAAAVNDAYGTSNSRHGSGDNLSTNLLSLSLDEEEQTASWDTQHTRMNRIQVQSSSSSATPYTNSDMTL